MYHFFLLLPKIANKKILLFLPVRTLMIIPEMMVITKPMSPKYKYVTSYIARWSEVILLKIDISNNLMTSNCKDC